MTRSCLRSAAPLDERSRDRLRWRRQWALSREEDPVPEGWRSEPLTGGLSLRFHVDLFVEAVVGANESLWALGQVYDPLRPSRRLADWMKDSEEAWQTRLEACLPDMAGCYVLVLARKAGVTVYTDPAGMMSIFHARGRAASTPGLLPGVARDPAVDDAYRLRGSDDWYPGSLTPYVGVKALLANHALDVGSGEIRRFWPREEPERLAHSDAVECGAQLLRGSATAVIERGPTLVSLTGGRDSRVVLAASRAAARDLEFFTIRAPGVKACDIRCPQALGERFSLDHHVIESRPPDDWALSLYDEIASDMVTGAVRSIVGGCQQISGDRLTHMNGNLGAMTKSYFWGSRRPRRLDANVLIRELIQRPDCIRSALDEWVATLPALSPTTAYNLMYLEQRGARYMGIRETASNLFYATATPFNSRRLFEAISGAPLDAQFGGNLLNDYVRALWPELLEVPYCPVTRSWGMYLPKAFKESLRGILEKAGSR